MKRSRTRMQRAMHQVIGSPATSIFRAFDRMGIAEEEIAAAKERYPARAEMLHEAFKLLCPPMLLRDFSDDLYRAHARELLMRVVNRETTAEATSAEIVAAISHASLTAPLDATHVSLAAHHFAKLFPGKVDEVFGDDRREPYKGAWNQAEYTIKKRLFDSDRVLL